MTQSSGSVWRPTVEERAHPPGEQGVRLSLEEVAKRATKGSYHPRVTTWARNTLEKARSAGQRVKTPMDRARVLLGAVQKKLWVPDPVGAEFIAGAHLLACDDESDGQVCVKGADCDELVVVLAAALSSVGIYTMIVGHAYDKEQRIEHVLCAVHCDGKWHYADPSTDMALGKCVPFSRERLLSMPNVQVLCDDRSCLSSKSFNPEDLNFVSKGVFVGVDGPREQMTLAGLASNIAWLSEPATWLGDVAVIDLKDPATMIEVKRMMGLLQKSYSSTSPTWSASDWLAYSHVANALSGELKVTKEGNVAYAEDGTVTQGKWPPSDKLGFPSFVGIKNMADDIVKNGILKATEVKSTFPRIASYGQNVIGVTAPNFGAPPSAAKASNAAPILLGLLALGGVGLALLSARPESDLLDNRAREPVDEAAADELLVYLENDTRFSPDGDGIGRSILVSQLKKWRRGNYDANRAPAAWIYAVDSAAVAYAREFGGEWHRLFNKPTREVVARELASSFERRAELGEFDHIKTD